MTIHIPEWVLWIVGVPLGLLILLFAFAGIAMLWGLRSWM